VALRRRSRRFLLGLALALSACACESFQTGDPREENAFLESNDWFRTGVDRFYLAYAATREPLPGGTRGEQHGNQYLFGLGCHGEPADLETEVTVPEHADGTGSRQVRLYERAALHDFPIARDRQKLADGRCELLFGDERLATRISAGDANSAGGDAFDAGWRSFEATAICAVAAVQWVAFTATIPGNASGVGILVSEALLGGAFASSVWCAGNVRSAASSIAEYQDQENRALLFEKMSEAERITDRQLLGDEQAFAAFSQAVKGNDIALSAAIYNRLFVPVFNGKQVQGSFEQGWGWGPRRHKFFDAVRDVMTELGGEAGKTFHDPANSLGNQLRCDGQVLSTCRLSGDAGMQCLERACDHLTPPAAPGPS
jgi:hypothetical protein